MTVPITFVDVETTGLSSDDRVVSIGVVHFPDSRMLEAGEYDALSTHLIFNPGRPSHPRARKVHGYSDAELAHQDAFELHAQDLRKYFEHGGSVVAHNASFDKRFIEREFAMVGLASGSRQYLCTMLEHRRRYGSPSGLDAVLKQMGREARTGAHGALQDAWHAMEIYAWLHGNLAMETNASLPAQPMNYRKHATQRTIATPPPNRPPIHSPRSEGAQRLWDATCSLATIVMFIARADGEFTRSEVETICLLLDSRIEHLGFEPTGAEYIDLLDRLCAMTPSAEEVSAACKKIAATPLDRSELASWVKQATYADGSGNEAENGAIQTILGAFRRAG